MKHFCLIFGILLSSVVASYAKSMSSAVCDTVIRVGEKTITITDSEDDFEVIVEETMPSGNKIENEKIFRGVYRNGRSIEQRYRNTLINRPNRDKEMPVWGTYGFGSFEWAGLFVDDSHSDIGRSHSYRGSTQFFGDIYRLNKYLVLTYALGWDADIYRITDSKTLKNIDGVTTVVDVPGRAECTLTAAYLKAMPALAFNGVGSNLTVYIAPVLRAKVYSAATTDGPDGRLEKLRRVNLNTFSVEARAGINYRNAGLFFTYSLTPLFRSGKGPKLHPYTFGLSLSL
ncbi:hypothetical protein [Porphyromonas loveana]|uniref:hypothetical protein n=1 Tax=Porphyromonas loveana TaxID=1884669 RepID=UPI0035A12C97